MKKTSHVILWIAFVLYTAVMLWLLFGLRIGREHEGPYLEQLEYNLLPFETVWYFGRIILTGEPAYLIPHAWRNLIGNSLMLIPMGFCLPCFFESCRKLRTVFLIGLLTITIVEFTQFFTLLGSLDFDDFMLNLAGLCVGFGVWSFWHKRTIRAHPPVGD